MTDINDIMNIIVLGMNHKNAPLEIREQFSLSEPQQELLLSELKNNPSILEAFVFSTCNRVEVYAHLLEPATTSLAILKVIFGIKKIDYTVKMADYFYHHQGKGAIEHLFRVSAGLDSMVLGEKQILGQVKVAFERAKARGMFAKFFHSLSSAAIRVGKKARNETDLGVGGSSVSWAAIAKAEKELGPLQDKAILIIGAGEMSDLAVGHIHNKGFKELYLMNRTLVNAENLAEKYNGKVVSFCDIKEILAEVDVCICSVGAPHYILDHDVVAKIMPVRHHKDLVLIDISVPRNIEPRIAHLNGVRLFYLDDLQEVVDANMELRRKAIGQVEEIIHGKVAEFLDKTIKATGSDHDHFSEDSKLLVDA